jgi:hypothetical protein
MKQISIDLDWTLFDLQPLYSMAFPRLTPFWPPESEDIHQSYSYKYANKISNLLFTDEVHKTPLIDSGIPKVISDVLDTQRYKIYYISDRALRDQKKTFFQLKRAGIKCDFTDVYDIQSIPKMQILRDVIRPAIHFDDSPTIIQSCIRNNINCIMISGDKTPFNHCLRDQVKWYPSIVDALKQECLAKVR